MSVLPVILIGGGYVALIYEAGWLGAALAVAHIGVMLLAIALGSRRK